MKIEEHMWDILTDIIISSTKKAGRREKIIRKLLKACYMVSRTEFRGIRCQTKPLLRNLKDAILWIKAYMK